MWRMLDRSMPKVLPFKNCISTPSNLQDFFSFSIKVNAQLLREKKKESNQTTASLGHMEKLDIFRTIDGNLDNTSFLTEKTVL